MLNEFNRIARQMLFLHGHLVRPGDWAETPAKQASSGHPVIAKPTRKRVHRLAVACATSGLVTTTRLIVGQLR
jgi:hypothetical protein